MVAPTTSTPSHPLTSTCTSSSSRPHPPIAPVSRQSRLAAAAASSPKPRCLTHPIELVEESGQHAALGTAPMLPPPSAPHDGVDLVKEQHARRRLNGQTRQYQTPPAAPPPPAVIRPSAAACLPAWCCSPVWLWRRPVGRLPRRPPRRASTRPRSTGTGTTHSRRSPTPPPSLKDVTRTQHRRQHRGKAGGFQQLAGRRMMDRIGLVAGWLANGW